MRIVGLILLVAAICPRATYAQANGFQTGIRAAASLRSDLQSPPVPLHHTISHDLLAARRFSSRAPGATLMIVGGSAIIAGILVGGSGGTVLILGGVGVGAYGVYLYTR